MTYGDNPAQRLLDLLTTARGHGNSAPVPGWAAVFEIEPTALTELLRRGADTVALADETRRQVEALPEDDPALVLAHFGQVEQTVLNIQSVGAHQTMANFLAPLGDTGLYSLQHAASLLHCRRAERTLSDSQLERLSAQVYDLMENLLSSDLEQELSLWMVAHLRQIESALQRVRVTGTAGVEQATDQLVGGVVRSPSRIIRMMNHPAWQGTVALITALNLALGAASDYEALTSHQQQTVINQYYQLGGSGGEQPPETPALPAGQGDH